MKVYRVERSNIFCGEWESWLIDNVFSTPEKAYQWISENPMPFGRQRVVT